jgi:hypothetical protein
LFYFLFPFLSSYFPLTLFFNQPEHNLSFFNPKLFLSLIEFFQIPRRPLISTTAPAGAAQSPPHIDQKPALAAFFL